MHEAATCGKRQRVSAMDGAPGAGSAQAVGVVPGGAAAVRLAAAIDAAPGLLTTGAQISGPQGLSIDCRYAVLPTALYYGRYVRPGRLSDKGFHKFEPLKGFSHFNQDFLSVANPPNRRTAEAISHDPGKSGRTSAAFLFIPLLQVTHSGARRL